jgi:hypothetical protein
MRSNVVGLFLVACFKYTESFLINDDEVSCNAYRMNCNIYVNTTLFTDLKCLTDFSRQLNGLM